MRGGEVTRLSIWDQVKRADQAYTMRTHGVCAASWMVAGPFFSLDPQSGP